MPSGCSCLAGYSGEITASGTFEMKRCAKSLVFFSAQTYGWVQKDGQMDVGGRSSDSSEFFFWLGKVMASFVG